MRQKPRTFLAPLLNEQEVAEILGISVRTIQEWRQSGEGPPFLKLTSRKRGAVRYDLDDLRAYVEKRRVRSTAERHELPVSEALDSRIRRH